MIIKNLLEFQIFENKVNFFQAFTYSFIITFSLILLINQTSAKVIYLFLALIVGLISSFSPQAFIFLLIFIIVTPKFAQIHHSILYSLFIIPTFLFNYSSLSGQNVRNVLLKPLIIFILLTSISLVNAPKNIFTFFEYFNLIALFLIVVLSPYVLKYIENILTIFNLFILFMTIHSVYVIIFAISLKMRAFGLLGVYYVDFAGLAFLYSLLMYLYSFNLKRFFYALTSLINLTGLILSQTRNAWLSTFLILLIIILLLSLKGEKFHIKKKTVMILSTFIIFLGLVGFLIIQITTQTSLNRIDIESQSTQLTDNTESVNENSFVSRLFIWHTAINAFRTEPIIGIGMYSFKYTTHKYYTIPKPFFKQFVENKTPHISYLEILVEAGIIGFLGFIYFLFVVFRQSLNLFRANPLNPVNARARLLIIITVFYVIVSMFMTEAWVYGQYLVWFGIILGALIAEQNRSAQNV